ncbi:MAG TPA: hypothetical protein VLG50_00225 [Candidatus Saccharimonadales bacterium]|nr:hypothetical protein [Candidatus Saccharimonadales bacterium]
MKKISIMFMLLATSGGLIKTSQTPENSEKPNIGRPTSIPLVTVIKETTDSNGDIRLEFSDGTYARMFAYQMAVYEKYDSSAVKK